MATPHGVATHRLGTAVIGQICTVHVFQCTVVLRVHSSIEMIESTCTATTFSEVIGRYGNGRTLGQTRHIAPSG